MANRGDYCAIYTGMADDPDFLALSPAAKLITYTLKMILGASGMDIVRVFEAQMMDLTGLPRPELDAALDECRQRRWIMREGHLVWLRNGLRYNPTISLENGNHRKGVDRHLRGLPRQALVAEFRAYYGFDPDDSLPDAAGGYPHGTPMGPPRDVDPEYGVRKRSTENRSSSDAIASGDAEDVENSPDVGAVVAPLVRKHFWLGAEKPPRKLGKDWSMGREISIARQMVARGLSLDELAGVIEHARAAANLPPGEPTSFRLFHGKAGGERFSLSLDRWRKAQLKAAAESSSIIKIMPRAS